MITLVKWHRKELDNFRKEMDTVFNRCFGDLAEQAPGGAEWSPCVDVVESSGEIVVRIELPGLDPGDLDVLVEGRNLTIQGHKGRGECSEEECYRRRERSYGSFFREIELPSMVDPDKCEAVYKNGVLVMTLPKWKTTPTSPQVIPVH